MSAVGWSMVQSQRLAREERLKTLRKPTVGRKLHNSCEKKPLSAQGIAEAK